MKRLKSFALIVVLIFTLTVIAGCVKNNEQSKSTSSYESSITTSAATSNTVSLSESELRQRTMKIEYLKLSGVENITESRIKEIGIKSYGAFGNCEAVMFNGLAANAEEINIDVSGYEFYFPSSEKLFIFDGDTLTDFKTAFEEGKITLQDIEALQQHFKPIE